MTQINTHAVVLSHNSILCLAEADFRPRAKVNDLAAVWNFFSLEKELSSEQPAEQANFTPDVSRCDVTDGLEESTAHFHNTLVESVIALNHPLKQNKMFFFIQMS